MRKRVNGLRSYRPGMAMRMALGFAALAIVIAAANVVTQRSSREARERMRQLVGQHEPMVRSTQVLATSISDYERAVINYSEGRSTTTQQVDLAANRFIKATDAYAQAAGSDATRQSSLRQLYEDLELYRTLGNALIKQNTARRSRVQEYWSKFAKLESHLNAPQASAVRFAGGVFASESLLELSRAANEIRDKFSAVMSTGFTSWRAVGYSESAFDAALSKHAASLNKLQGEQWIQQIHRDYAALVEARRKVATTSAEVQRRLTEFRDQGVAVAGITLTQLVEPAQRALTDADQLATQAAQKADRQFAIASAIVLGLLLLISLITVMSVTRPVQRLTEATHKLANGLVRTRVPRGGVRELDALAVAFNTMAEQLEIAEIEVRSHNAQLEAKVDDRTRELQFLANHDPLTQLPNRRQLFAHLEGVLYRAQRAGARVAFLFIDLDNFKTINDSLGHAYGDRVLQAVSERLRQNPPFVNCFSARLGGDEFTVVCEGVKDIAAVDRACLALLEEFQRPLPIQGRELRLSVSVGAAVYPDHAADAQSLLRAADAALFRAKELGRNCWSMFKPALLEVVSARFRTEQSLRRAVERGELELLYQPQVCFETLKTQSVEALLRWHQPDGEVMTPSEFLDIAEQSGLIMEISEWVLRTSIENAAGWYQGDWPHARVAVNISAQQLLADDFVERVEAMLRQYELPAACLELELTENILQTGAATVAALHRLRALGVSIALDDFGIGYSSLTSLERLPLTRVKIDRSLIANVDGGGRAPAIVRSIIGLSRSLGLQVTAEGVERPAQLGQLLTDRGVQIQGFLICRPVVGNRIPAFIDGSRQYLEELLISAPLPEPDVDRAPTSTVRALRPAVRTARTNKGSSENT
jgi:diguanylate cyclase (GGDEF)-like protein